MTPCQVAREAPGGPNDDPSRDNSEFNVLFKGADATDFAAQGQAFSDYWEWNPAIEQTYRELIEPTSRGRRPPERLVTLIEALRRLLGEKNMAAYLAAESVDCVGDEAWERISGSNGRGRPPFMCRSASVSYTKSPTLPTERRRKPVRFQVNEYCHRHPPTAD
jgi:hypothetical protein